MEVRDTLLLACGTANSRSALRSSFGDSFNLLETGTIQQTMLFLKQNRHCIATVLLGIVQEEDISILLQMAEMGMAEDVPVIAIMENPSQKIAARAFELGAADVIFPDYDPFLLHYRIQNIVDLYQRKWYLEDVIKNQETILQSSNNAMVDALSSIIEYRSVESGQHILRIRHFTKILLKEVAKNCPEYKLTDETINIISSASALHDVGKIAIPDAILNKPGRLTAEEWDVMKSHTVSGCKIIESLHDMGNQEYIRYAHNICHYHHERWNGGGYPEGISGDEIPICAQVVGIADVYDALTTSRVYKDAYAHEQAVNMILNGECGVFSPKLLSCFKQVSEKFRSLAKDYADGVSPKDENFDVALPGPDYQNGINTLHFTEAKYLSLLHHMDGTAIEVDLDKGLYHSIYSPHIDLAPLCSCTTFLEAQKVLYQLIVPEEHAAIHEFLYQTIPEFFQSGNRRQIHYFHMLSATTNQANRYQVTLLRPNPNDESRKMLLILQRSTEVPEFCETPESKQTSNFYPEDAVHGLLTDLFRYRNDRWFTLESKETKLSALLGYTPEELQTLFNGHLIELVHPDDREMVREVIHNQLQSAPNIALGYRLSHKDGHSIWVLNKSHLVVESDGIEYLYGTLTDVTQAQQTQQELRLNLERYQTILSKMESIIFEWNPETDVAYFSKQWEDFFGYSPLRQDFYKNFKTENHFHPDDLPEYIRLYHEMIHENLDYWVMEARIADCHGRYRWFRIRKTAVRDTNGRLLKIIGLFVNIDDEKMAAKALIVQAEQDALTKLLNKATARKQFESHLLNSSNTKCALLIIDLDNFKHVNDHYGHLFGDAVLTQVAEEIKKLFRAQDIIARIGGDEFMVVMRGISDQELIRHRCTKLVTTISSLFREELQNAPLGCSIGIALCPEHGNTYNDLFRHADQALYQTKRRGKNGFSFYDAKNSSFLLQTSDISAVNEHIDSDEQPGLSDKSIVQYTFQRLYDSGDVDTTINDVLAFVGQQLNVSRVYIFENSADNKTCSNTYEWCNVGIAPEIEHLQNISYETDIPNYEDNFDEHGVFYCPDVTQLAPHVYDILEPQGIKSMLQCAIYDGDRFCGYVGFDECSIKRYWTKDKINTLLFFSEMLSLFLLKRNAETKAHRLAEDLRSILDMQDAWIYVIDPQTYELKFLNEKAKTKAAQSKHNSTCHMVLNGYAERCPDCIAQNVSRTKPTRCIRYSQALEREILSEISVIQWEGKDAYLIVCRDPNGHANGF